MRWIAGGLRCFVLWIGLAAVVSTAGAGAGQVSVSQDADLFGDQQNRGELCAPTATANSFRYLENTSSRYRDDQGENLLTGDNLEAARDDLAEAMGSSTTGGTNPKGWWEGMVGYMEQKAPDQTRYKGMVDTTFTGGGDPGDWDRGSNIASGPPTFAWLFGELEDDEAVQLGLFKSATEAHAVSLTGLSFEDDDGDGQWDAGSESAEIGYIDPDNPGEVTEDSLHYNANTGRLEFMYGNTAVCIGLAYSESPVPLPGTMALLVMGIAGAGLRVGRQD